MRRAAALAFLTASGLGVSGQNVAAQETVNFAAWSAAVEQVKSHITAFEEKTGIKVEYSNAPWAQYREAMITKLVGNAPIDVLWVSDAWLPEWADAGWLKPIDGYPNLIKYNKEAEDFATDSMTYKGHQYGLTYYAGFMSFMYNEEMLKKAGITEPPQTWEELTQQAKKIKEAGIAEYPVMMALAKETWLIEFLSAMVYSNGGHFVDDSGKAVMADPQHGAVSTLHWLVDAINKDKILSPAAVDTGELAGLKAFSAGQHAFALLPRNRIRVVNDPKQSQVAGKIKMALMPMGPGGSHATVGWMRFYGLTKRGASDPKRADAATKFIEWFGGRANGEYKFQKIMMLDFMAGFAVKPLYDDPEIRDYIKQFADIDVMAKQQSLARKKDVIASWFGEWNEFNGEAWHEAILQKATPEEALTESAKKWDDLKKEMGG